MKIYYLFNVKLKLDASKTVFLNSIINN